jgi:hypothetical protein
MLGNDQIETLAERRGITKQCSRGAVPPDDFARAVCIDDSICDLIEDVVSQLGPVFHGTSFASEAVGFARYSSAGERSALRRIWRVALQTRARSSDRTRSLAPVSKKREYFKVAGDFRRFDPAIREIGSSETAWRSAEAPLLAGISPTIKDGSPERRTAWLGRADSNLDIPDREMPFEMSGEFPRFFSKCGVGDFCSSKLSILIRTRLYIFRRRQKPATSAFPRNHKLKSAIF